MRNAKANNVQPFAYYWVYTGILRVIYTSGNTGHATTAAHPFFRGTLRDSNVQAFPLECKVTSEIQQLFGGEGNNCMTAATTKKIRTLIKITRTNMTQAKRVRGQKTPSRSPFVVSAAKYYPALKKLAEE